MVDANSVLQLLFHQRLPRLILLLRITGCFRASLGMHPTMSQLYEAAGTAGKRWQWWGLEITLHQVAVGSASSSCYTHRERLHNLGSWAWQQHGGCSPLPHSWAACVPAGNWMCSPTPPPRTKTLLPSLPSQAPTRQALGQQPLSLPRLSPSTPGTGMSPGPQTTAQAGMVLSLLRPGFAMPCAGAPLLLLWGLP